MNGAMAGAQPQSKRRRLDAAATLSKPFKSPLRKPIPSAPQPAPPSTKKNDPTTSPESSSPQLTGSLPRAYNKQVTVNTSPLTTPTRSSPLSDPEVLQLQKKQRALMSRLAALRSDLDTARQAQRIESSTKDAELEVLIRKWRLIAQDAADEVFTGAKERVSRMGGMNTWRERVKRETASWGFEDDAGPWSKGFDGDSVDEEDMDARREELEAVAVALQNGKDESCADDEEKQDEVGADVMLFTTLVSADQVLVVGIYDGVYAQDAEYRA